MSERLFLRPTVGRREPCAGAPTAKKNQRVSARLAAVPDALLAGVELEREYRTGPELVRVLRGASVEIRAAELVALVGASGVGKSTLLHLLGALDRPTGGRVLFQGEELFSRSEPALARYRRQDVGFVFFVATHNPDLARKADRIYRLVDGRAREVDPSER